ncbi:allantoate amidohydrolase [Sphaerimonospora sp. CA-214678]|uniref:allantoate amidohydrolase n=1 Tax=Sphaerimonospora sp. CA-214678 TaxID=3240029 RepID=UPI003D8E8749
MTSGRESFDALWTAIEPVGRDGRTGGYRRFAWTAEDATLREWFAGEAAARGLDLVVDRAGNQWAWWGDPDAAPSGGVVVGSHLDSVPDGGAYDGPLGVVSAFAALDALRAGGFEPARPIGVVNFVDEEGARFGVACAGSRIITGALDADRARGLRDGDGTTMAEAMARAGHDPARVGPDPEALRRVGVFVELHVEQGRGLVDLGRPVAVASSIWPHGRWRLELLGEADHAGTTRLADRRDPMLTLASVITTARSAAAAHGCVATIGKVHVTPNGVNAIPSAVHAWLDARGPYEPGVRAVVGEVAQAAGGAGAAEESFTAATVFPAGLRDRLAALLDDAPVLGTGAGHDAGILAAAGVPAAMLFVRNPTGVSHSPAEHASYEDCLAGVAALARVIEKLAVEDPVVDTPAIENPGVENPGVGDPAGGAG